MSHRGHGGESKGQVKAVLAERRHRVAELYLRGWPQHRIGQELGVSQSVVSTDLKAIQKEWLASSLRDFDEARAQELAKIDHVEAEYLAAWERSKLPRRQKNGNGAEEQEERDGNPSFLTGVERCILLRCKLLGLEAPQRIDMTATGGVVVLAGVDGNAALGRKPVDQVPGAEVDEVDEADGGTTNEGSA